MYLNCHQNTLIEILVIATFNALVVNLVDREKVEGAIESYSQEAQGGGWKANSVYFGGDAVIGHEV